MYNLSLWLRTPPANPTPADFHSPPLPGWVYCAMATAGVSLLERQRCYQAAIDRLHQLLGGCCCPGRRGDWWQRLTTDLEHLNK